jgi:ankyrin repeat protein
MTPLHLAVLSGSSQVVKKLLLGGCDRTIKSKTGQSAYDLAI